jgi:RND family efflux transporter MFP subunit
MKVKIRKISNWLVDHWIWLLVSLVVLGGIGYWYYSKTQAAITQTQFEKPQRQTIERTIDAAGIIRADQIARLRFLAGGKVTFVGPKEGEWVKKGQTLAVIDRATLQKQLQQNLNSYERERYDWEGYKEDIKDTASTNDIERDTKSNQLTLNDTVLSVEIQDIAIRNTVLSAPFAGILTVSPTTSAGVQLTAADFFEVVDPESMQFIARIDEADIAQIQEGQSAVIELDAFRDKPIESRVSAISFTSVETGSGTQFEVEFPIASAATGQFRLGMNGDVTIKLGKSENAFTIPLLATRTRSGKTYVDVKVAGSKTEEREIETGIETDERIEVVSGLSENDEVAVPE